MGSRATLLFCNANPQVAARSSSLNPGKEDKNIKIKSKQGGHRFFGNFSRFFRFSSRFLKVHLFDFSCNLKLKNGVLQ